MDEWADVVGMFVELIIVEYGIVKKSKCLVCLLPIYDSVALADI